LKVQEEEFQRGVMLDNVRSTRASHCRVSCFRVSQEVLTDSPAGHGGDHGLASVPSASYPVYTKSRAWSEPHSWVVVCHEWLGLVFASIPHKYFREWLDKERLVNTFFLILKSFPWLHCGSSPVGGQGVVGVLVDHSTDSLIVCCNPVGEPGENLVGFWGDLSQVSLFL
jgi:hypothetical protein